jgi:hypothetical protein
MKRRDTCHPAHKLFARTRDGLGNGDVILVTLFSRLSCMKPTTDAQTLPTVVVLTDNNLLNRMKAASGLHLEKYKLVPRWRDALCRNRLWLLQHALGPFLSLYGIQLERATPFPLPELVIGQRHVKDV